MKKVEKFRLTKDQTSWYKKVKEVTATKALLTKGALQEWFQQGEVLKKIFSRLDEQQKMLNMVAPEEKMNEIPGQEAEKQEEDRNLFVEDSSIKRTETGDMSPGGGMM